MMSKSQIALVAIVGCAFLAPASWVGLAEATTPNITSLTPASGNASGGYTVTIAGSSFNTGKYSSSAPTNGNTVRIHRTNDDGLTDLTGINTTSSTSLTFTMPDCTSYGATSIWIEVNGEGNNGGGTSGHLVFTFVAPTASSLNVTSGNVSGGYPVTINGANFNITTYNASTNPTGGNTIRVHTTADNGLTDLTGINATSSAQLTFTMPDCTSYGQTSIWLEVNGTGNNTGGNSGVPGGNSGYLVFTFASPTITSISPTSGNMIGGYPVTITGTFFNVSSTLNTVRIHDLAGAGISGGDQLNITATSSTSITFTMPNLSSLGLPGVTIQVNNLGNNTGATTSGSATFSFPPTTTSLSPSSGNISGGYPVTITGTNFNVSSTQNTVRVHTLEGAGLADQLNITAASSTSITFTMPNLASLTTESGITIQVNNLGANTGTTSSGSLTFTFAAPTITSVSPTSGNMLGGYPVTITGTNFNIANTLNTVRVHTLAGAGISGGDQLNITATSSTSITFTMPNLSSLGLPGVTIQVNNLGNNTGATTSGSATFSFPPTTTSLSPSSGNISGGYPVTITGTNFNVSSTQNTVRVHTLEGAGLDDQFNITAASSTSITFTMPNLASLTAESGITIQVNNLGANTGTTSNGSLTFTFAAPTVTSLSPTHGAATGGYPVTIAGTNFNVSNTLNTVRIHNLANGGNTPSTDQLNITATSSTSITFTMPNLLSTGLPGVIIQVNNLGNNTGATGGQITFAFDPTVTAVSPASASVIGGSVTITGTNFIDLNNVPASQVFFGTSPATSFTVNSATSITAVAPAGAPGSVDVTVVVASLGTTPTSSADLYSYQAPTISSATPNPVGAGAGAVVTINGQYFTGINTNALSSVTFGGVNAASITFVSDTQITALPTYPGSGSGIAVTVGSSTTSFSGWSFAGPSITSVSPNAVDIAGNTPVVITGQYFTGINTNALSSVTFAGVSAQSITFVSDTQLTAITAPSSAGTGSVAVTVGSLTGSFAPFAYGGDKVSSINPASGPISGGTTVTIAGVGFSGATAVSFGSTPATSFTINSDISITAVSPPAAAGSVNIIVTKGGVASNFTTADQFTFYLAFNYQWTTWTSLNWSTPAGTTITWNSQTIAVAVSVNYSFFSWYAPATQIGVNPANGALSGTAWSSTTIAANITGSNPTSGMNGPFAGVDPASNAGNILSGDWKDFATGQLSYYNNGTYSNAAPWNNQVFWSYYNAAFPGPPAYSVMATTTTITNTSGSQYFLISDGLANSPLGRTNYIGSSGMYFFNSDSSNPGNALYTNGPFFQDSRNSINDISDGTSNTFLFGESLGGPDNAPPTYQLTWMGSGTMPSYWDCQTPSQYFMFSSMHPAVVNFAFCDGSVRSVTKVKASVPPDSMGNFGSQNTGDGTNTVQDAARPPAAINTPRWVAFQLMAGVNDNITADLIQLGLQ